jgi:hypothetical protein
MQVVPSTGVSREASDHERANFVEMGLMAQSALSTAIARLRTQQDLFADAQESRIIRVRIGELEADIAKMQAELLATLAEQRLLLPPSDTEVAQVKELAEELDALTAGADRTVAILGAATSVANAWAGRQLPAA